MSVEVVVSNRQKKVPLDMTWVDKTAAVLAKEIWADLKQRPAAHLSINLIEAMEKRGTLSLAIVDNREIQKLNCLWRGMDSVTDVLSFPLSLEEPPQGLPWELGEIIISAEKAYEQANSLGHSFSREVAFLFAHGALHVLGFDHETATQEKEMLARQKEVLDALGLVR